MRMSLSRSASALPISPNRFCSATLFLASLMALAAASFPRASMYPDSSRRSVTFTLISFKPILRSSASTFALTLARNLSRSELISSMSIVAMTRRNCPNKMSLAKSWIFSSRCPSKRSAALVMLSDSVDIPTVKRQGTSTRIFCLLKALVRLHSMEIGVRSRKA